MTKLSLSLSWAKRLHELILLIGVKARDYHTRDSITALGIDVGRGGEGAYQMCEEVC